LDILKEFKIFPLHLSKYKIEYEEIPVSFVWKV
jgi:hypothetical protein